MNLNIKNQKRVTSILSILPFLIFSGLSFFYFEDKRELLKEIISFFLLNTAFFSLAFLMPLIQIRNIIITFLYFLITLISFFKLSFIHIYNTKITGSALFVIFETNTGETVEYLNAYFTIEILFLLVLHLIPFSLVFKAFFLKRKIWLQNLKLNTYIKLSLILIPVFYVFQTKKRFYNQDILFRTYYSYEGYQLYKEGLNNKLSNSYIPKNDTYKVKAIDSTPQTHVVIIGESLTSRHMSLYGYPRKTNPELEKIKDELIVFNDVISPHTHTITSLLKVLTLADFDNPDPTDNFSIVQMANEANYETYWISNQEPIGLTESIPTIIGRSAKNKFWLETENFYARIYDDKVLPVLKKILDKPDKRKVVFIHLMGVHGTYDKRYPEEFDYYKDTPPQIFNTKERAIRYTNYYDNAVRYNDYVIRNIISLVKEKDENSSITYFSDHGEEVYDTMDFMGHQENAPTNPMYEIPFILWFSEKFKEQNSIEMDNIRSYTDRKYILEDFPYIFADLTNIQLRNKDLSKNLIHKKFKYKPRVIRGGRDYDKK